MRISLAVAAMVVVVTALPRPYPQSKSEGDRKEETPGWVKPALGFSWLTALGTTAWGIKEKLQHERTKKAYSADRAEWHTQTNEQRAKLKEIRASWEADVHQLRDELQQRELEKHQENRKGDSMNRRFEAVVKERIELDKKWRDAVEHSEERFMDGFRQGRSMEEQLVYYYYIKMEHCKKEMKPLTKQNPGETDIQYDQRIQGLCLQNIEMPESALAQHWWAPERRVKPEGENENTNAFSKVQLPALRLPNTNQMSADVGQAIKNVPNQAMLYSSQIGKTMPQKVPMLKGRIAG